MTITARVVGIDETIQRLTDYSAELQRRADEMVKRLAQLGYDVAYQIMAGHIYSGETINSLTIVQNDIAHYTLMASSEALLFFEFGAGTMGAGHPQAGEFGMGPGTYPGQKHAFDPNGWWFPTDDPNLVIRTDKNGQGWGHSYGNTPHMPFYNASRRIRDDLEKVAMEVFNT